MATVAKESNPLLVQSKLQESISSTQRFYGEPCVAAAGSEGLQHPAEVDVHAEFPNGIRCDGGLFIHRLPAPSRSRRQTRRHSENGQRHEREYGCRRNLHAVAGRSSNRVGQPELLSRCARLQVWLSVR